MRVNVTRPSSRVSKVRVSSLKSSGSVVTYSGDIDGVATVTSAIDELAGRFQQQLDPPSTMTQGDLWYDKTNDKLKVYDGSAWGLISGAATALEDEYFKFTSSDELLIGNLAEFVNDDETIFAVSHDGIVKLRDVGDETPDAIAGGLYVKDNDLYFGQ